MGHIARSLQQIKEACIWFGSRRVFRQHFIGLHKAACLITKFSELIDHRMILRIGYMLNEFPIHFNRFPLRPARCFETFSLHDWQQSKHLIDIIRAPFFCWFVNAHESILPMVKRKVVAKAIHLTPMFHTRCFGSVGTHRKHSLDAGGISLMIFNFDKKFSLGQRS